MDNLLRYHFNYFTISTAIIKRFSYLFNKKLTMDEYNISELLDMSDWSNDDETDADSDFQLEVYL